MSESLGGWHNVLLDSVYFARAHLVSLAHYLSFSILLWILAWFAVASLMSLEQGRSLLGFFSAANFLLITLLHCGLLVFIDALSNRRNLTPWQSVMIAAARLPAYIIAEILVGFSVAIGLIFLLVPGIYIYARLLLVDLFVVLAEKNRPLPAITFSLRGTRGNVKDLIILVLVCVFPILALSWVAVVHRMNYPGFVSEFFWAVMSWMMVIFWSLVRYRCYLLLKDKKTSQASLP